MITIQLPNIAIQKVTNGYVVQWQKINPVGKNKIQVSAVCIDKESLLATIDEASNDISIIEDGYQR